MQIPERFYCKYMVINYVLHLKINIEKKGNSMKKKELLLKMMIGGSILLTGCQSQNQSDEPDTSNEGKYRKYEIHLYDAQFKHTEELEVNYDQDGTVKNIAGYAVYDASAKKSCKYAPKPEKEYTGAKSECTENSDGSLKYYNYLTDEAIQEGAFDDSAYSDVSYTYEEVDTEEKMNALIDGIIDEFKKGDIQQDDTNYIIRNEVKVDW